MKTQTIEQHEDKYWHIPKVNLLPLLGLVVFILLAIGNFQLIDKEVIDEVFNCEEGSCNLISNDLINIYPIIGEYILISLALISLVAMIKGGYNNLRSYKEDGLIFSLIAGLIAGLIVGLIAGLIVSLIFSLIAGLIVSLIAFLIAGLSEEFN